MRLGVLLPTFDVHERPAPPVAVAARHVEDVGLDAAWVGDHLACAVPVLDASLALAAAATATSRIHLGWSVMLLGLRAPAWAAKQVATIERLSGGGRLSLGVGVGGEHPEEFTAAGVRKQDRGRLVDDALAVLPALLRGEPVRAPGLVVDVDAPALLPAMPAPPRVLVGGRREPALRRTARFGDAWLPMWLTPEAVGAGAERLAELADAEGRPAPEVVLLVGTNVDEDPARAAAGAAAHIERQYRIPYDAVERWTLTGPAEQVAERLEAYRAVGVDEVIAFPLTDDPLEQYERLAGVREHLSPRISEVLP